MSHVYFIRAGDDGPIKIGRAVYPRRRMSELQVSHHETLTILAIMPGGEDVEASLHRQFASLSLRGEWFRADAVLLAFIEEARREHSQVLPEPPRPSMDEAWAAMSAAREADLRHLIASTVGTIYGTDPAARKRTASHAQVTMTAVENWLGERSTPALTPMVHLARANKVFAVWLFSLIEAWAYADERQCSLIEAYKVVSARIAAEGYAAWWARTTREDDEQNAAIDAAKSLLGRK